jgi:hypothetical protein
MTTDYRAMCAELLLFSEEAGEICMNESLWPKSDPTCTLQQRARALLAQPVAEGPTDEELTLTYAYAVAAAVDNKRGPFTTEAAEAAQLAGLRAVLAKWGNQ